jgi:hypothetical protein
MRSAHHTNSGLGWDQFGLGSVAKARGSGARRPELRGNGGCRHRTRPTLQPRRREGQPEANPGQFLGEFRSVEIQARPASPHPWWIYTRLQSLSPGRVNCFRPRTCVQSELSCPDGDHPVQRSLAPQQVMLSRRIIAYYYLIRASRPLLPVYGLSSRSLPYGLVWAGNEKVPNLICLSFPIVPSSVPRRLDDCSRLLLDRPRWPSPPSHRIGVRTLTLAGSSRESCYYEAAKFTLCYGPTELLAPLRLGRLLSSFHLLGHPWGVSNMTTRANNQFPWPDFHRRDKQPYRLRAKDTGELRL